MHNRKSFVLQYEYPKLFFKMMRRKNEKNKNKFFHKKTRGISWLAFGIVNILLEINIMMYFYANLLVRKHT